MAFSAQELTYVETHVANEAPSTGATYLLWLFLGFFSAHRFYLGRPGSAIAQLLLNFIVIGWLWTLIDAFLIPGMITAKKNEIRARTMTQLSTRSMSGAVQPASRG